MKKQILILGLFLIVSVSILIILTGCDVGSAEENVYIEPSSVTIREGESIEFTAFGGYEYTWSLPEDSNGSSAWGILSTRTGNKTVYTSLRNAGSNETVRILTVSSSVPGNPLTNSAPDEWTAEAYITQM